MTDEELRELQERVELIEKMTETQGWELLLDAARAFMLTKQQRIVQGKCESMEEYKADCAFGDGMQFLVNLPSRLQLQLDLELSVRAEAQAEEEEELV